MNPKRPDVFKYPGYVEFLADWLTFRKASQSDFSMRSLAKKAGLASGYLPMVLGKKRPLSHAALLKIMPFLGLSASEQSFLENLVTLGTTDSHETRVTALERMQRFQKFQKHNSQESEVYDYLTHWYYVAIREMATLPDFKLDAEWVQERLRFAIPLSEVKNALTFLVRHGFLKVDAKGHVRPPEKSLECAGEVFKVALAKFHREVFGLAARAIDEMPSESRNIMGHTCVLSEKSYEKAKQIMENAIRQIRELGSDETDGNCVYHMEAALFPLTETKGSKK